MDKEIISQWAEAHREEFLEDIKKLVRIPSDRGEPQEGAPFGPGPDAALKKALEIGRRPMASKPPIMTAMWERWIFCRTMTIIWTFSVTWTACRWRRDGRSQARLIPL